MLHIKMQGQLLFDVKTRELVIPIMKEMSKDIQDLMTLHEVGHALFTSLDMLQESIKRKLDHSFVNVIEDVRIEKRLFRTNIEVLSLLSKEVIKTLSVWTFLKLMVKI